MPNVEDLKSQMASLPSSERAELAYFLIHSLDADEDADAEEAWAAELDRRCAEVQGGKVQGVPAARVFEELRKKLTP